MYVLNNDVTYFNSFGVEHIPKEIKAFIGNKNIRTNIFRMQAYDLIMCGYFYLGFIDLMLSAKTWTDFTNLFSPNNLKKWWYNFKLFCDKCLKMAQFHETPNIYPNLNISPNDQHFRLYKINGIRDHFVAEIKER